MLQCGPKSSSVKAVSLFSWTAEPPTQLETPAHLTRLLNSPAQVEVQLYVWFGLLFNNESNYLNFYLLFTVYSYLYTESDHIRLVGGISSCIGILEMKHQTEWRPVDAGPYWTLKSSAVVCRQLDCGSAVSTEIRSGFTRQPVWWITPACVGSESSLRECGTKMSHNSTVRLEVICSGKTHNDVCLSVCLSSFSELN